MNTTIATFRVNFDRRIDLLAEWLPAACLYYRVGFWDDPHSMGPVWKSNLFLSDYVASREPDELPDVARVIAENTWDEHELRVEFFTQVAVVTSTIEAEIEMERRVTSEVQALPPKASP